MSGSWTRRGVLAASAAVGGWLAGFAPSARMERGVDGWPFARRDARRSGYDPEASGPRAARERWRLKVESGVSAPVAASGAVYVGGDSVFALSAADGSERWHRVTPFSAGSPPAVARGAVYAASKVAFYSIEAGTGDDRWFDSNQVWRYHAPVVAGDTLYLGATKTRYSNDFDAHVVALSAADGSERWRAEAGSNVLPPFAPAVADGTVYVGRDAVYAFSVRDGSVRWTFEADGVTAYHDPAVAGGTVYVSAVRPTRGGGAPGGVVFALSAADGTERWRFETGLSPSPPAVTGDAAYVTSDAVYALSAADGTERWRFDSNRFVTAAPAVTDRGVYVAGVDGVVQALSPDDGSTRWRLPVGTSALRNPALAGGSLYVTSTDGTVVAIGE